MIFLVATTSMAVDWYIVAKDFQPLAASLVALSAAVVAWRSAKRQSDTTLRVAERQVRASLVLQRNQLADAWRKSQVDRLRLGCNSLAEMTMAAEGIQGEIHSYRVQISGFATTRIFMNDEHKFSKSDPLWNDLISRPPIGEQFPILRSRSGVFDNAPIVAQSLFYAVMKETEKYESVRRDLEQTAELHESIHHANFKYHVDRLDNALSGIKEPIDKLHDRLNSTVRLMSEEEDRQTKAISEPSFDL